MNILTAHHQWATRPDDERFWDLAEMHSALEYMRSQAREETISYGRLMPMQGPCMLAPSGASMQFTHDAFTRYATDVGIPAEYARQVGQDNPSLLRDMLCHAHARHASREVKLLVHQNGAQLVRAVTGPRYRRVWHDGLVQWCQMMEGQGWSVPPARPSRTGGRVRPAGPDDVLKGRKSNLSIKEGDMIGPAGLYASWTDMFVFMVDENRPVMLTGRSYPMYRAFMLADATDGTASLRVTAFLYDVVCGNHILWGAHEIADLRLRHQGEGMQARLTADQSKLLAWSSAGTSDLTAAIQVQQGRLLGPGKPEVIDACRGLDIPAKLAAQAFDLAEAYADIHGDPRSAWGMMSGLTRLSQTIHAGDTAARLVIDTQAARLLEGR